MIKLLLILHIFAHPFLPLVEDTSSTADYKFEVQTDRPEFRQANTKGTLVVRTSKWENMSGKKYLKFITSYQGIPFMKDDVLLWRREENGNIYLSNEQDGKINETLELPADVSKGAEWNYNDGVESKRKVSDIVSVKLAKGQVLENCIEVTRIVLKNESLKAVTDKSYYCKDKGNVKTIFIQPSPVGDYKTETLQQGD